MQNVIPIQNSQRPSSLLRARVRQAGEGRYLLDSELGVIAAQQAFSCFLTPEVDDLVLMEHNADGSYILSVLERESAGQVDIRYPAGVVMRAAEGDISMQADNLRMAARERATVTADRTSLVSSELDVLATTVTSRSQRIESCTDTIRLFARNIDTVADQVKQRAASVIRWVEGVETLNVGNLVQHVRHSMTSRSTQVVMTAKQDVRIDGERIHMG